MRELKLPLWIDEYGNVKEAGEKFTPLRVRGFSLMAGNYEPELERADWTRNLIVEAVNGYAALRTCVQAADEVEQKIRPAPDSSCGDLEHNRVWRTYLAARAKVKP